MPTVSAALLAGLLATSGATPLFTLHDPTLNESSGLARSGRHADLLWTHNDGGTVADIVGVGPRGRSVARLRLRGIDPYDPEALAPGRDGRGRPALFLGDIGDNSQRRPDVSVFRVTEPRRLGRHTRTPTWFRFRYPDGPHDAEALLVDPRDGRIWVATKSFALGSLYRAPLHPVTQDRGTNTLRRVADVPPLVTDGAFLAGGRFVLRTYTSGYLYDAPGHLVRQFTVPIQEQGESIALDGNRLLVGSEGVHSPVYALPLPTGAAPSESPSGVRGAADKVAGEVTDGLPSARRVTVGAVVFVLLMVLLVRTSRRYGRRR
jgi:hypothetical protein